MLLIRTGALKATRVPTMVTPMHLEPIRPDLKVERMLMLHLNIVNHDEVVAEEIVVVQQGLST